MIATKKSYETPNVQFIQFDGNVDTTTASPGYYFSCEDGIKGNYRDWGCDITYISDNSLDT